MDKKPIILAPVRPNAGVTKAYQDDLQAMVLRMARALLRAVEAAYSPAASHLGMDADPTVTLRQALKKVSDEWIDRFNRASDDIAEAFASRAQRSFNVSFKKRLRRAGFTVKFRPTARTVGAYRAVVAENVNLIRSIPQKFLTEVQSIVWVDVMKGSDLHTLSQTIKKRYGITARRAAFIATDQNAKARAVMEEARRSELGITEAIWIHSKAGKEPRPTHVAMDGQRYNIKQGMWDSAVERYVWPGTEPRCRCVSRSILPT